MNTDFIADLYHQHKEAIIKFILAGIITAIMYFSLFALLWHMLHLNHLIAVSVAYISAAAFHFFVNRMLTFQSNNPQVLLEMSKYIVLIILNYFITILILEVSLRFSSSPYIGLVLASGITAITSFLISRYWVFKQVIPS